jgi:hypothetical protein
MQNTVQQFITDGAISGMSKWHGLAVHALLMRQLYFLSSEAGACGKIICQNGTVNQC